MTGSYKFLGLLVATTIAGIGTASSDGGPGDHGNNLPLYLTRTLGAAAQDSGSPGNMWAGSGLPATNFLLQENLDVGVEVAVKAHYRQGQDIPPSYVDGDGSVHVIVPSGPQVVDPAHGVPVANSGRAAWNFTFSVNVAPGGVLASLDDYDVDLLIDLDPSKKVDYLKLKLTKLGPPAGAPSQQNGYGWKAGATVAIGDDEGTSQVSQNSQNLAFYAAAIDTDKSQPGVQPYTFGPGEFDVVLSIRAKHGNKHGKHGFKHGLKHGFWWDGRELARVHAVFDVVDP
jgi:hypothetical protein